VQSCITGLVVLLLAVVQLSPVWVSGFTKYVPATGVTPGGQPLTAPVKAITDADTVFVAARVRRNALGLLEGPSAVFEHEICAPREAALSVADPMIAAGLMGIPGLPFGAAGPMNVSVLTTALIKGLGMAALVTLLTGSPWAGRVSAIYYALNPVWVRDVTHFYIYDMGWTVWAIYFAYRLFARASILASLGLASSLVLQASNCFYPTLASAALGLPFLVWLVSSKTTKVPTVHLIGTAILVGAGTAWIYGPYLSSPVATASSLQAFTAPTLYLPGGPGFPGVSLVVLATIGLLAPTPAALKRTRPNVRIFVLTGIVLCVWLGAGPTSVLPDLYGTLSSALPGLSGVRAPGRIGAGLQVGVSILCGFGVAIATCNLQPRARRGAGIGLTILAAASTLLPVRLAEPPIFYAVQADPPAEAINFFRALGDGNRRGALLEIPPSRNPVTTAHRAMLSTYHRRSTSACYGASTGPVNQRVRELTGQIDDKDAIRELRALGFATIVVHHEAPMVQFWRNRLRTSEERGLVQRRESANGLTEYSIVAP